MAAQSMPAAGSTAPPAARRACQRPLLITEAPASLSRAPKGLFAHGADGRDYPIPILGLEFAAGYGGSLGTASWRSH